MSTMSTTETETITATPREAAHQILRRERPRMGDYAHDILDGVRALSGADLAGEARRWSSTYQSAREAAVDVAACAGGHIRRHPRTGRIALAWGVIPGHAVGGGCALGDCWTY